MGGDPGEDTDPADAGVTAAASVTVYPDGPLILRGDFEVRHVDGPTVPTGRLVALCRCGRSAVKPLCDGSHKTATSSRTAGAAALRRDREQRQEQDQREEQDQRREQDQPADRPGAVD